MKNKYLIRISGKDTKRFIRNLIKMKIEILDFKDKNTILVSEEDYLKILDIKTMYKIEVIEVYGLKKYILLFKNNRVFIFFIIINLIMLFLLSNIVFDIEVSTNDLNLKNKILLELEKNGIKENSFKLSFSKRRKIISNILSDNKDILEWLEIEEVGTKYIVKVEPRKKVIIESEETPRDIIAKKDGVITHIYAENGEIVKKINDYVKKGDIIISGKIMKKDEVKKYTTAKGKVKAEVWYTVDISVPFHYYEEKKTGKSKNTLAITVLNKTYNLFDFNKYKDKKVTENNIVNNLLLPIKITWNKEEELEIIDKNYTKEELLELAYHLGEEKLKQNIEEGSKIKLIKDLKITEENSKIMVELFFKVEEEIGVSQDIVIEEGNLKE